MKNISLLLFSTIFFVLCHTIAIETMTSISDNNHSSLITDIQKSILFKEKIEVSAEVNPKPTDNSFENFLKNYNAVPKIYLLKSQSHGEPRSESTSSIPNILVLPFSK